MDKCVWACFEAVLRLLRVHADDLLRPLRGPSQLSLDVPLGCMQKPGGSGRGCRPF